MPVIVRVAADLQEEASPWALNPGEIKWIKILGEAEAQGASRIPDIRKIVENKNQGLPPEQQTPVPADSSIEFMLKNMAKKGLVTKEVKTRPGARAEVHWKQLPAARKALKVIGQRMSLWGVLRQLLTSGRLQKEDVIKALQSGWKEGAEEEILGLLEPSATAPVNPVGGA